MQRFLYQKLIQWKTDPTRRPLILEGARQVGKTWLLKEFGKREFRNLVYFNCDNNPDAEGLFADYDTGRIIRVLRAIANQNIIPEETLIFFDEIQEAPKGMTALKYFAEEAPEYAVAAAGSLLGMEIHQGTGFPVGKVDELKLYPMSFGEFLLGAGKGGIFSLMQERNWETLNSLSAALKEQLRIYYYTGGMPAAVRAYAETGDFRRVRRIQTQILKDYRRDFSKHAPKEEVPRIAAIWDSIHGQIAKDNRKFFYSKIRHGARAKEYEKALMWLSDAGLVCRVPRVSRMQKPLGFYAEERAFKLFLLDLGLMGAMARTRAADVVAGDGAFVEYKGAFSEQYVAQQFLSATGRDPYYYANERSTMEIDFVTETENVIAIEVKAEENLKSKSLKTVLEKDKDIIGWRFSMSGYREQERITNIPLFLAEEWFRAYLNSDEHSAQSCQDIS